eukprot:936823-Pyramimonas_sp.AAC.1
MSAHSWPNCLSILFPTNSFVIGCGGLASSTSFTGRQFGCQSPMLVYAASKPAIHRDRVSTNDFSMATSESRMALGIGKPSNRPEADLPFASKQVSRFCTNIGPLKS